MAYLSRAKLKFEAFCYFITYTNVHWLRFSTKCALLFAMIWNHTVGCVLFMIN